MSRRLYDKAAQRVNHSDELMNGTSQREHYGRRNSLAAEPFFQSKIDRRFFQYVAIKTLEWFKNNLNLMNVTGCFLREPKQVKQVTVANSYFAPTYNFMLFMAYSKLFCLFIRKSFTNKFSSQGIGIDCRLSVSDIAWKSVMIAM